MGFCQKSLKRCQFLRLLALVCIFTSILYLLTMFNSALPDVTSDFQSRGSNTLLLGKRLEELRIGELGEMMVAMLPDDLAFTIFVPSERVFHRVLKLKANESLLERKVNETYAILSRVMGFSAVPCHIVSAAVPIRKEMSFDSVSGFTLYAWRDMDGTVVVNNVRSELVNLRKAEIIVHVMNGVIMDSEFEQSFSPDYEDQ